MRKKVANGKLGGGVKELENKEIDSALAETENDIDFLIDSKIQGTENPIRPALIEKNNSFETSANIKKSK
mgnify:CR=1 FL=1